MLISKFNSFKLISSHNFSFVTKCLSNSYTTQANKANEYAHFFGFEQVSPQEKQKKVQDVFTNVASKYDLMNDVMSFGIHRLWKDYFIHKFAPQKGTRLLDVAGGTGDIAFRFLKATLDESDRLKANEGSVESHVTVFDLNPKMLAICNLRAKEMQLEKYLSCVEGNAEEMPFDENAFDAYTIAFGIRNVVHIDKALSEAFKVLKPGGRFLCLEFSHVMNPVLSRVYDWYSNEVIPPIGEIVAGDWKSYQYLVESIRQFPHQEDFSAMLEETGFKEVTYENLSNGIAAIHSAYKL